LNAWTNFYYARHLYRGIWAHYNVVIHKSLSSFCLSVRESLLVAKQRLGKKRYRGNEYTCNNRRIVVRIVLYAVRVILNEIMRLFLRWIFLFV
jgi:hypothetical protein